MTTIGPQFPRARDIDSHSDADDDDDLMGPQLPPGFAPSNDEHKSDELKEKQEPRIPRPSCPAADDDDDDDDDLIGPLPPTAEQRRRAESSVANEFESRDRRMKDKLTRSQEEAPRREAWMTELPDLVRKNFGLAARGFRKDAGPGGEGRREWTETPAEKERRRAEAAKRGAGEEEEEEQEVEERSERKKKKKRKKEKEREEKIRKEVDEYNSKKRGESLLELHRKKMKKKEKKEKEKAGGKAAERVPFSREKDLEVNRFDDAKRNRLIKQCAKLNSRFSHGATTSSFL